MLRKLLRQHLAVSIASLVALGGLLVSASSANAGIYASGGKCSATIDNPHYSSGGHGVVAKAHWKCAIVPTTIINYGLNLWVCTDKSPTASEGYLATDPSCHVKGNNEDNSKLTVANKANTVYVPPGTGTGAKGSGWWIACAVWQSDHDGTKGAVVTTFSGVWYGSG